MDDRGRLDGRAPLIERSSRRSSTRPRPRLDRRATGARYGGGRDRRQEPDARKLAISLVAATALLSTASTALAAEATYSYTRDGRTVTCTDDDAGANSIGKLDPAELRSMSMVTCALSQPTPGS